MKTKYPTVLALIPARSGSKSILDKNIRIFGNRPLLAHSIRHALESVRIERIIVSTNSERYAQIAREYGAETPFLRPAEISGDNATDLEAFTHVVEWLSENEGKVPEILVHLRPTHPIREISDIDAIVDLLLNHPEVDSIRSIAPVRKSPFKMWFMGEDRRLSPVVSTEIPEAWNQPRQKLPKVYMQNACIDVVRSRVILEMKSMTGKTILGYPMNYNFDIDTEAEWLAAERFYLSHTIDRKKTKTYCFDIDGVIASIVPDLRYDLSRPIRETIEKINRLYDHGNEIVLFTARGTKTGTDWKKTTKNQMRAWGVKYHRLIFGKPAADFYIDDKCIHINDL